MGVQEEIFPGFGRFLIWVVVLSGLSYGAIQLSAKYFEKTMCNRASDDPVHASRDVLRDCGLKDPLGR